MKKSEKLLDAIGQIDDRLVAEAAQAGKNVQEVKTETQAGETARAGTMRVQKAPQKHSAASKKSAIYRWRGPLSACAALLICVGIWGMLSVMGIMPGPFGTGAGSSAPAENVEEAVPEMAAPEMAALTAEDAEEELDAVAEEAAEDSGGADTSMAGAGASGYAVIKAPDAGDTASKDAATNKESGRYPSESGTGDMGASKDVAQEEKAIIVVSVKEASPQKVTFVMENLSGTETIFFDNTDSLLWQKQQEVWQMLDCQESGSRMYVQYDLLPGEKQEFTIDVLQSYGELAAGQYRLAKEYQVGENAEKQTVYVEFTVE